MSRILPQLYLGDQQTTKTIQNINVIISIGCNPKSPLRNIESYKFSVPDSSTSDMTEIFEESSRLIHEKIENRQVVLVHCKGGINRSPMVVLAYLCKYCQYSVGDAVIHVTGIRKGVRIQSHYLNQLTIWLNQTSTEDNSFTKLEEIRQEIVVNNQLIGPH
jgi:protein-tyrosine phosphatase